MPCGNIEANMLVGLECKLWKREYEGCQETEDVGLTRFTLTLP